MSSQEDDAHLAVDYDALFASSSLPTLVIDHQRRRITRVNQSALDLLGLEESQILGRPGADFLVKPSQEQLALIRGIRGDETALLMDVPTTLGTRTCELNILPSGVEGVVFLELVDQTELLHATALLQARSEEADRTATALSTIAGRMAHDLRGPMTSIAGFANLLTDASADLSDEERARLLERIAANASALAALTGSILGEADTGATRPEDDSHDPDDLFRLLQSVAAAQLAECGGVLETRADIDALPVPVGAIRQAVINLVSNSIKYRDPDQPLRVQVEVRSGGLGVEIAVRDNGKGLDEVPEQLFEAGARGAAAAGTPGAGLGLAFVQAAVERLRGTMAGASLSPGAEFVITLPASEPVAIPDPEPGETGASTLTAPQLALALAATPVALFVIDIAVRQIVFVNQASVDLLGTEAAEILGRPGSDFLDEESIAEALRRRVLDSPDATSSLHTTLRAATRDIPARIWISAVQGTALAVAQAVPDAEAADGGL